MRRLVVLLIFAAACSHISSPTLVESGAPTSPTAASTLQTAARAMGGEESVAAVTTIDAAAACVGPTGRRWTTRVASARDGRFLFEQVRDDGSKYAGGFDGKGAWECADPNAPCGPLDAASRSALQGHEFHMIALAPESRFAGPATASADQFEGKPARTVTLHDAFGAPVEIFYDPANGLPLGLHVVNHTGRGDASIAVAFERWEEVGPLRLFKRAVIRQGEAKFTFDFGSIEVNRVRDGAFLPPESPPPS